MSERLHQVAVRVGGKLIQNWTDYEIVSDMLQPAHPFRLSLPGADRSIYDLVPPDAEVQVMIDDATIITGYVDDRAWSVDRGGGTTLTVSGRDKSGRLVDESMPLMAFEGLTIKDLAARVCDPWFGSVTLSNAQNRRLLRGDVDNVDDDDGEDDGIAAATNTKGKLRKSRIRVHPGQSRWQTFQGFAEEAEVIGFATADGKSFFVGQPDYAQPIRYRFLVAAPKSVRAADGNVISLHLEDSVGERYSQIIACGAGAGTDEDYADAVTAFRGVASNGPGKFGEGKDFSRRKVLMVSDGDVRTQDLAQVRAAREMAYRDATGRKITITARGHGQQGPDPRRRPPLFAIDTLALVEVEPIGIKAPFLITTVTFRHSRNAGETTELALVPKGTVLRA